MDTLIHLPGTHVESIGYSADPNSVNLLDPRSMIFNSEIQAICCGSGAPPDPPVPNNPFSKLVLLVIAKSYYATDGPNIQPTPLGIASPITSGSIHCLMLQSDLGVPIKLYDPGTLQDYTSTFATPEYIRLSGNLLEVYVGANPTPLILTVAVNHYSLGSSPWPSPELDSGVAFSPRRTWVSAGVRHSIVGANATACSPNLGLYNGVVTPPFMHVAADGTQQEYTHITLTPHDVPQTQWEIGTIPELHGKVTSYFNLDGVPQKVLLIFHM